MLLLPLGGCCYTCSEVHQADAAVSSTACNLEHVREQQCLQMPLLRLAYHSSHYLQDEFFGMRECTPLSAAAAAATFAIAGPCGTSLQPLVLLLTTGVTASWLLLLLSLHATAKHT